MPPVVVRSDPVRSARPLGGKARCQGRLSRPALTGQEECVLESIPRRLRGHLTRRAAALRSAWVPIAQMAVAAGLSWWVAHDVVGHTGTFFAPVAAAIVLRVAPGQRTR